MRTCLVVLAAAFCVTGRAQSQPSLTDQQSGTTALLQAISVMNERVVWVSGHKATWSRSLDGGATWTTGTVPGDTTLQFRDVHAVDGNTAFLLGSGTGPASRIYFTSDAGKTWRLQHTNPDSAGFYDCMDFWDRNNGLVYGDEVGGQLVVLRTTDGGAQWSRVPGLPAALKGEGGFAASGTCLVSRQPGHAWIGTGAGLGARVVHTGDRGATWGVVTTDIFHATPASGIATLSFLDSLNGFAAGGDIGDLNNKVPNIAITTDGGKTWSMKSSPGMTGAIYGSAYVPGRLTPTVIVVSPKGAEYSITNGGTWMSLSAKSYWAVGFAANGTGWMVGPGGRITKLVF